MERLPAPPHLPRAACRDEDPDLFFPRRGGDVEPAKAICRTCPELAPCRAWALGVGGLVGVWGGTTQRERRRIRHAMTTTADLVIEPPAPHETNGAAVAVEEVELRRCAECGESLAGRHANARLCRKCRNARESGRRRTAKPQVARRSRRTTPTVLSTPAAPQGTARRAEGDLLALACSMVAVLSPGWAVEVSPDGCVLRWPVWPDDRR